MRKILIISSIAALLMLSACGNSSKKEEKPTELATMKVIESKTEEYDIVASGKGIDEALKEPEPTERDERLGGRHMFKYKDRELRVANLNLLDEDIKEKDLTDALDAFLERMRIDKECVAISFTGRTEKGYSACIEYETGTKGEVEFRKDKNTWGLYVYYPGFEVDEYGVPIGGNTPGPEHK